MKTKHIFFAFIFINVLLSCGVTKKNLNPDDRFIGDWSLITEATPQGDVPVTMTISKNESGNFIGSFTSMMGNFAMSNLVIANGKLSCEFNVQGMVFEFKGTFDKDEFKGLTMGPMESYVTNGKRKTN